jgi:hypothetical protein
MFEFIWKVLKMIEFSCLRIAHAHPQHSKNRFTHEFEGFEIFSKGPFRVFLIAYHYILRTDKPIKLSSSEGNYNSQDIKILAV